MTTFAILEDNEINDVTAKNFQDRKPNKLKRVAFQTVSQQHENQPASKRLKPACRTPAIKELPRDELPDETVEEARQDSFGDALSLPGGSSSPIANRKLLDSHVELVEYADDILKYLNHQENVYEWPKTRYMRKQTEVTDEMRTILVDWLASVAEEYDLSVDTLHLTVNYVDRFISKMLVFADKFQLLGAAAMFVASKVEDVYPTKIEDWVYLCGDCYNVELFVKMELLLLKTLDFKLQPPTASSFIKHFCAVFKLDSKMMNLAMYLSELVLMEGDKFVECKPSALAASSLALARLTLQKKNLWPRRMEVTSGYKLSELSPVLKKQNDVFRSSPLKEQKAIRNKYLSEKYDRVAALEPRVLRKISL